MWQFIKNGVVTFLLKTDTKSVSIFTWVTVVAFLLAMEVTRSAIKQIVNQYFIVVHVLIWE